GEFATAGVYKVETGETLRHLIDRVGGLSERAYLFGAQFARESVRAQQQKTLEEYTDRLAQDIERSASLKSQNVTNPQDAYTLQAKLDSQRRLLDRLRIVKATGRVVLNLRPDSTTNDLPDLVLEDGDRFSVPYQPATVSVLGAVYN